MRIGILGGAFDPIHQGHLALADAAVRRLRLDRLLFVPVFQHPLREKKRVFASAEDRLEMIRLAIQNDARFQISDCELKRGGISYTVETLSGLRKQYPPPHELFFITGGDWGKDLKEWKAIRTIFSLAHFVVASRPGFDLSRLPSQVEPLDFAPLDISSTRIRERLKKENSAGEWIPASVQSYIQKRRLYGCAG